MDADPPHPWTPQHLHECAERCSNRGEMACWRVANDAVPCEECKLVVELRMLSPCATY